MLRFFLEATYYWVVTAIAAVVSFLFYPCKVFGRENVPVKGGFILASNHESNIDPLLLPVVCPRRMRFMAKDSLFKNPVLAFLIKAGGGFPVRRASADRSAIAEFLRQLSAGFPVLIFPQGTRDGKTPQPGVGFLAVKSGKPVVPVYIHGSRNVLGKGHVFLNRSPVSVVFGSPLTFLSSERSQDVAEKIMSAIFELRRHVQ